MLNHRIRNNPYTSEEFETAWLKHFSKECNAYEFNSINDVKFVRENDYLFINLGKNSTNGISYRLNDVDEKVLKGKTLLLMDIPGYFSQEHLNSDGVMKIRKSSQYKGYLANLTDYESIDSYLQNEFKSKTRSRIRNKIKKMDKSFQVKFEVLYGNQMSRDDFNSVFEKFKLLLEKRYNNKRINNHWLSERKWEYLEEVFFEMQKSRRAILFILSVNDKPVAFSSNFKSDDIVFSFLPAFDVEYSKFNPGTYLNYKILDWCIKNDIKIYDFSKGDYDYKKTWGNLEYGFEYHVLYDPRSLRARLISKSVHLFFEAKQYLRKMKIHEKYHKYIFMLNRHKTKLNPGVRTPSRTYITEKN